MKIEFSVVSPGEFPDDELVCPDCLRVIRLGQPYTERLLSMARGAPITELVCVYCPVQREEIE
jgi:hypothetical protein